MPNARYKGCEDEGDPAPESKALRQDDVLQAI